MTTTRQIELFVKVAELGSMRLAAEALDIAQPTVSKHIQALERHVGGELFERNRGERIKLSSLGWMVLGDATQSLQARQRLNRKLQEYAEKSGPVVFVRGFMSNFIKRNFEELQSRGLPHGTSFVLVDDQENLFAKVENCPGSLSLLRSAEPHRASNMLSTILRTETLSLYASPDLAAAIANGAVEPSQIQYFLPARSVEFQGTGDDLLEVAGLASAIKVVAPQFIELTTAKVSRGDGVSVFFDWHVRHLVTAGKLVRLTPVKELGYLMLIGHMTMDRCLFGRMAKLIAAMPDADGEELSR